MTSGYHAPVRTVRLEFTVEPFEEGVIGAHVAAALDRLRDAGFEPDVGPFGNAVEGEAERLLAAMAAAATASFAAGATGMVCTARAVTTGGDDTAELLAAVAPLVRAVGGRLVAPDEVGRGVVPLTWKGQVVAGVRTTVPSDLRDGVSTLVQQLEEELGGPLAELSRVDKQRAVRLLDERGAFALRNAVDEVADILGVSRVTVYNYLNATRAAPRPR